MDNNENTAPVGNDAGAAPMPEEKKAEEATTNAPESTEATPTA